MRSLPVRPLPGCGQRWKAGTEKGRTEAVNGGNSAAVVFCAIRNVIRNVFFHLNDSVCHVEVRTGASGDENRRDAELLIQIPHAADKRCDRFLAVGNDALHQLIAHHKVGGGRVLVDQKEARAGFDALDHVGGL